MTKSKPSRVDFVLLCVCMLLTLPLLHRHRHVEANAGDDDDDDVSRADRWQQASGGGGGGGGLLPPLDFIDTLRTVPRFEALTIEMHEEREHARRSVAPRAAAAATTTPPLAPPRLAPKATLNASINERAWSRAHEQRVATCAWYQRERRERAAVRGVGDVDRRRLLAHTLNRSAVPPSAARHALAAHKWFNLLRLQRRLDAAAASAGPLSSLYYDDAATPHFLRLDGALHHAAAAADSESRATSQAWVMLLDGDDDEHHYLSSAIAHANALRSLHRAALAAAHAARRRHDAAAADTDATAAAERVHAHDVALAASHERAIVCLVNAATVSAAARAQLAAAGVDVRVVRSLSVPRRRARLVKHVNKLYVWSLTEYSKVVFIDLDMVLLRPLDFLFDWPGHALAPTFNANPDRPTHFNSGLMVVEPSRAVFASLRRFAEGAYEASWDTTDQALLDAYFPSYTLLPWFVCPKKRMLYTAPQRFRPRDDARIRCLHWTGEKPWRPQKRDDLDRLTRHWYAYLHRHVENYTIPASDYRAHYWRRVMRDEAARNKALFD